MLQKKKMGIDMACIYGTFYTRENPVIPVNISIVVTVGRMTTVAHVDAVGNGAFKYHLKQL